MKPSQRKRRRSSRSERLLAFAFAAALAACGGLEERPTPAGGETTVAPPVAPLPGAGVRSTDDGRFVLVAPDDELRRSGWVSLMPVLWPAEAQPRPVLGVAYVTPASDGEFELDVIALREVAALADLRVEPAEAPRALPGSKLLVEVDDVDGNNVLLGCGEATGVSPGDLFFALSHDPGPAASRLGDHVGALLRIVEVGTKESVARIEHANSAPEAGDLAFFAQAQLDIPVTSSTILVAPLDRDGGAQDMIPPIVDAVPDYLAEFGLSNIGVATIDEWYDPTAPNAPRDVAQALEERDGYGAVLFGDIDGDELIVNLSTWGRSPHPGSTVGILPGGLPLSLEPGLETLSTQLAPGVLANVLAMRGDHAVAIYLLEVVLRREALEPDVRYHLREHLALRYDAIGRYDEALSLMRSDIAQSEADGATLPLLNALSIRASLANENGLTELWLRDTRQFLDVADGVLPVESLGGERLGHARALAAVDRLDDAASTVMGVVDDADAWSDDDLRISGMIDLALLTARDDDAAAALVLDGLLETPGDASRTTLLLVDLLSAELALALGDQRRAMSRVERALSALEEDDALPLRAAVFRRASGVFAEVGRTAESVASLEMATRLYLESAQLTEATGILVQLAMTQLRHAGNAPPREAIDQFQQARANLYLGAELAVHLGYDASAARAFMYAGMLESQFEQAATAEALFDRAQDLATRSAHYPLLYEINRERAQIDARRGDFEAAQTRRDAAVYWAEAAGIEPDLPPIEAPSF